MDREIMLLINDLWLALDLYVNGTKFNETQKVKHRQLILEAQRKIGIPDNLKNCHK